MYDVLIATIIGPGKEYCSPFLAQTLRELVAEAGDGAQAHCLTVMDGSNWTPVPQSLPGLWETLPQEFWGDRAIGQYARQARMRNRCREVFLSGDWTHLYFHDPDTIPPAGTLAKLLAHDAPMATALYNGRTYDSVMIPMWPQHPILSTEPIWCDGFGMGAMLIRRDVLEAVAFQDGEPGEDIGFGRDAIAAGGWRTLVDTSLNCWHVREDLTANRVTVHAERAGVVWTDYPHFVSNRYGAWERNVARHDLTPEQIESLPPGFESDNYARLEFERRPLAELVNAAPGGN